jgi:hypothetical protein
MTPEQRTALATHLLGTKGTIEGALGALGMDPSLLDGALHELAGIAEPCQTCGKWFSPAECDVPYCECYAGRQPGFCEGCMP